MCEEQQGLQTARNFVKNLCGQLLNPVVETFMPACLEQSNTSIKAVRADGENGFPFLNGLWKKITAHVEACQPGPRENEAWLSNLFAELVKLLSNLAIAPAKFVGLLIAIQRGVVI